MNPIIAYFIVSLMAILLVYFGYQSYKDYQKNSSRWFHILLGERLGEGLIRLLR